ncbi:MAG: replication initiator protein [Microvirus sp.]|nr:MAG: replication initiator protein [Microvirus sp.]
MHEAQKHERNGFLTLTLDDKHMPKDGGLDYREHMTPFWKRLRKRLGEKKISHYSVGEYGELTMRPHYHAVIFGEDFSEGRKWIRSGDMPLWTNRLLEESWGMGRVAVGQVNFETAMYTAGYVTKKLTGNDGYVHLDDETGEITWLEQPRAHCSVRPGIGIRWIQDNGHYTYAHDHVIVNGKKQKPPKYYDKWLEKRSKIAIQMVKEVRQQRAKELSPNELHARAKVAHARIRMKAKKL